MGREVVTPFYFQERIGVDINVANKLLGSRLDANEAAGVLRKMGYEGSVEGDTITISPPEYRNDFLHPVDIVEDIMIGEEMEAFEPIMPTEFTVGRYTPMTEFSRRVKDIMIGLGFQEMVYTYLGSEKEYIELMTPQGADNPAAERIIKIANPMTENYEYVRYSIIPSLLSSESVSGNAVYPHAIFEVGKVAWLDEKENYGSRTADFLGFLSADRDAGFNGVSSHVSAVFFYLNKEYTLGEIQDQRFIPGRCAQIYYKGHAVGIFGEVHPGVLENWGIQVPCTVCEIDLDLILEK
jgi:phenylalanyl-tRNA synthetase beta chain